MNNEAQIRLWVQAKHAAAKLAVREALSELTEKAYQGQTPTDSFTIADRVESEAMGLFTAAAKEEIYGLINNSRDLPATIMFGKQFLVSRNSNPSQSTNPAKDLMERCRCAAWAQFLDAVKLQGNGI